ncbi:MAG: AMP-dependent synthetase/ligase [Pirellulales bacterium]|nr:AMP-dependent synthetase/ligase [Pirellulales bacterium]
MSECQSLAELFVRRVEQSGDALALRVPQGEDYRDYTWDDLAVGVRKTAWLMRREGVEPGDRVASYAHNTLDWIVIDLAAQMARAVHVPLHRDLSADQAMDQTLHSGAKLLFLDCDQTGVDAFHSIERRHVKRISIECPTGKPRGVSTLLGDLLESIDGDAARDVEHEALEQLERDDLATILYTSGTTGEPKGVMLSHGNLLSNTFALVESFALREDDVRLNFLPFSHIFARTCDLYTWVTAGHQLALTECREKIIASARQIRPTVINGVPFFFDKVYRKLTLATGEAEPGRLQKALGGNVRACCSGGAALSPAVQDFFADHGVTVFQGYGLTESSPVLTISSEEANKHGTVGKPLRGVEVRIADDGEILARGPNIMRGYWNNEEATNATIIDGWLRTGDLGQFDDEGFLTITGRSKEIIVTAAGQNVAPELVENCLTEDPLILQAMVIGDGRHCLGALIVPDPDAIKAEIKRRHLIVWSKRRAVTHPKILELYRQRINERLSHLSHHEQIGPFVVLDRGFTPETGELTPSLKMRRDVIEQSFAREVESLFPAAVPAPPSMLGGLLPSWSWPFGHRT